MNKLRGKTMNLSIISLIVLVIVVAIGFIKKVNLGFLSIGVAFFLGTVGGMSAKEIAAGFSSSMFITLVGVTFLFGMASNNGTLELFSKISRKTYGSDSDSDVLPFGFYFSNRTGTYCSRYFDDNICNVPCF
jgi:predicted exporter